MIRQIGPKNISVAAQAALLRHMYPDCKVQVMTGSHLVWEYDITPSPLSESYGVKMLYRDGAWPQVFVITPAKLALAKGATKLPHVYDQNTQKLCLFYPDNKQWNASMPLAKTVIPWAYEWLYHYELWLGTNDEWLGGGVHPFKSKK